MIKVPASTSTVRIIAGNELPVVTTEITEGNKTFYFPNTPIKYKVTVKDNEDGSSDDGKINSEGVIVTFDYMKGFDMTHIAQGHQSAPVELPGKALWKKVTVSPAISSIRNRPAQVIRMWPQNMSRKKVL